MNRKSSSHIDGMMVGRQGGQQARRLGAADAERVSQFIGQPSAAAIESAGETVRRPAKTTTAGGLSRAEIAEALTNLPGDEPDARQARRRFRIRFTKKRVLIILAILLLIGLSVGGYLVYKAVSAGGKVFQGNIIEAIVDEAQPLKEDEFGRSNILLFGTSEDDPSHVGKGASLADSIMIASINQKDNTAFLMSLPRDLWVKYGKTCLNGYEGKINAAYQCGAGRANDEKAGAEYYKNLVGEYMGMDIQYYAHVNYTALTEAVNAVGGISVIIDSPDPRGILDRNFDWRCNNKCYYVKHANGPVSLDGEHALALARSRNAQGGYGVGNDYERGKNQRKILLALRDKAASAGTLANPLAVSQLIDSLGNNVRTNFEAKEIKTLSKLGGDIKNESISNLDLSKEQPSLITSGPHNGQSIVYPQAGLYDYSDIQAFVKKNLNSDAASLEGATIDVLNGSGVAGLAQQKADELTEKGLTIGSVDNAPEGTYAKFVLYDLSKGSKPATKTKLEKLLGVKTSKGALPSGVTSTANFVIIVGSNGAN